MPWGAIVDANVSADTVVINQLLWGLKSGGVLHNLNTDEIWSWSDTLVTSYGNARRGLLQSLLRVIAGALFTFVAFLDLSVWRHD